VKNIGELQAMGFEPDQARLAFELAKGNLVCFFIVLFLFTLCHGYEVVPILTSCLISFGIYYYSTITYTPAQKGQAVTLLVDQPDKIAAQLAASSSSVPPRRPSVPAISSNQKDAPPTHRRAKSFNKSQSLAIQTKQEGKKAWSPISSFFQQQKNSIPNSASVRKIGTWLGKAIEGLGFEDGSE